MRAPILFIHGISGGWQNWLENLPHFGARHRAIAIDLPGFGTSPMPEWEIGMPGYTQMVHDFCEALGLGRTTLVGNSMGGGITLQFAALYPERLSHMITMGSGFFGT